MKVYDAAHIRNVAVVGHGGCGKTQLVSALLFASGMVNRLGKVDDGTAVTDSDPEEIARKHTLSTGLAHAEWHKSKINLLDTPGVANFFAEARAALCVADAALVVVDAVSGPAVQTEKAWAAAEELRLPRLVALSRFDRDRASLERTVVALRKTCHKSVYPVHLPIGEGEACTGIVDVVGMTAFTAPPAGGPAVEGPIPADLVKEAQAARTALVEAIAETDETLMERFFEAGTLNDHDLITGLQRATASASIFPAICTAALRNIGIDGCLNAILSWLPAAADRPFQALDASGAPTQRQASDDAPLAAFVWKTVADQFAGRITLFRVYQGVLAENSTVRNRSRDTDERLGALMVMQGKGTANVPELHAGDIGAVAKLKDTRTSDVLGEPRADITFAPLTWPEPVLSYAIEPKSRGDEDKISTAMHRLEEEDGSIHYARDSNTNELLLSGQGQLHIEVTVAKLKRRFGVEVNLKPPRIPYRETITAAVEAHGRHKKQTGGHGQFGDCKVRFEPLPRGGGFEFVDEIFGGAIPRQFIPAVEKGLEESRVRGFLAGYPMVDFKAVLVDGSYHDVDSNELSFKTAGSLAFKDGMARARPTLLEPIMHVEVYAPSDFAGDLMGDLNGRRGRIAGMDTRGASTVIKAQVPMSEMLTYEQHLTSVTGGRGSYHMEYSHYEAVPAHEQSKIVAAHKAAHPHGGDHA
ncbi:MAG: elongation factor G [Vicinamibacterales bacterium]